VVEVTEEVIDGKAQSVLALVDGLHRCFAAARDGVRAIRVVVISGAPVPLMALPVEWKQVLELDDVPSVKRILRFTSAQEWRDHCPDFAAHIPSLAWEYFFYRNFAPLGSGGPRSQ